jgi:hypothetical protein
MVFLCRRKKTSEDLFIIERRRRRRRYLACRFIEFEEVEDMIIDNSQKRTINIFRRIQLLLCEEGIQRASVLDQ